MQIKKYYLFLFAVFVAVALYNYTPSVEKFYLLEQTKPLCIKNACEPQIIPDCRKSTLSLNPCQQISANLWNWINSHGYAAIEAGYQAAGFTEPVKSATIYCNRGIYNQKKIGRSGARWSQHSFRRACDGNKIVVNGTTFSYKGSGVVTPQTRDDRFFVAFLDNWGTLGLGYRVKSAWGIMDFNRGVRDCREDNRHCQHFHISKPCYLCLLTGNMGYE